MLFEISHIVRMQNHMKPALLFLVIGLTLCVPPLSHAQSPSQPASTTPQVLPGKGLAQHDFLYAGESKNRRVFIVRKGKVVWTYEDPAGKGEISDAVLLSNGNVLIAHQFAVKLISPEKKILWNYEAPKGTEIHTAMPIGNDHVLYVQNGDPAWVKVVNIVTGETKIQFNVPTGNPKSVHGHFRHARLTPAGTLMIAHMDMGKVCEYNAEGKELWSYPIEGAWGVTPLKNGNVLVVGRREIREVTHTGDTVAKFTPADAENFKLSSLQLAWRLPNGNTLINNWVNEWSGPIDKTNPPTQAVEMTPDKKVVWVLRSWAEPDFGPATTIQILDTPEAPEKVSFGNIK
jgi:outer membrane protein assembly factor BamB